MPAWATSPPVPCPCSLRTTTAVPGGTRRSRCVSRPTRSSRPRSSRFVPTRSEEHTSELQSHSDLVCRLLLEKKKKQIILLLSFICTEVTASKRHLVRR